MGAKDVWQLRAQNKELQSELERVRAAHKQAKASLNEVTTREAAGKFRAAKTAEELQECLRSNMQLDTQVSSMQSELSQMVRRREEEAAHMEQRVQNLQQELGAQKKEADLMQLEISQQQQETQLLHQVVADALLVHP